MNAPGFPQAHRFTLPAQFTKDGCENGLLAGYAVKFSWTEPYAGFAFGGHPGSEEKAVSCGLVPSPFDATTPCLSRKMMSPVAAAFLTMRMPMEYPRAASASRIAVPIKSIQNCFEKTALPTPTKKSLTTRHARTTKFGFGLLAVVCVLAPCPGNELAPAPEKAWKGSPPGCASEKGPDPWFENSASNSAFCDKANLPGIKLVHPITAPFGKQKVIFCRNYSSLSIDPLSKVKS